MVVHVKVPAMICFFVKPQNDLVRMLAVHKPAIRRSPDRRLAVHVMSISQQPLLPLSFFNAFSAYCVPRHTFSLSTEENMKENGKTKKKRNEWIECKNALALLVM